MTVRGVFLVLGVALLVGACVAPTPTPTPGDPADPTLNERVSGPFTGTVSTVVAVDDCFGRVDTDVTITSPSGASRVVALNSCLQADDEFRNRGPFTLTFPKGTTLSGDLDMVVFGPDDQSQVGATLDVLGGTGSYCDVRGHIELPGVNAGALGHPGDGPPFVFNWEGTATADLHHDAGVTCTKK